MLIVHLFDSLFQHSESNEVHAMVCHLIWITSHLQVSVVEIHNKENHVDHPVESQDQDAEDKEENEAHESWAPTNPSWEMHELFGFVDDSHQISDW